MLAGMAGGVSTTIPETGSPFSATGVFIVSGFETTVSFSGALTYSGLFGTLTVGGDGALPGGEASIWEISYTKTAGPDATPAPNTTMPSSCRSKNPWAMAVC